MKTSVDDLLPAPESTMSTYDPSSSPNQGLPEVMDNKIEILMYGLLEDTKILNFSGG